MPLFCLNTQASAGAARATAGQTSAVTEKLLPDETGLAALASKLDAEKKTPLVSPDTYRKPVQKAEDTPLFTLKTVTIIGNRTIRAKELLPCWAHYVGQKIGFNELSDIAYCMTKAYRKEGYFLSYAVIPVQDIDTNVGQVTFKVIEGYVDQIEIQKQDHKEISPRIRALSEYFRGLPLRMDNFERGLLLVRDLYPNAKAFFEPSPVNAEGATRVRLVIPPKQALQGLAGVNNYGTDAVGPITYNVGMSWAPKWQEEHKVDLSYQQSLLPRELKAAVAGYTAPIGNDGITVSLQGIVLASHPTTTLKIDKHQATIIGTLLDPLIRSQELNLYGGVELRYANQKQTVADFSQLIRERVRQVKVLALVDWADGWAGQNSFQFKGTSGLNVLNPISKNDPHKSRAFGSGVPLYFEVNFTRLQRLMGPFSVKFQADTQYAARELLAIDRFYSNGPPMDGAYPAASMSGDSGFEGKIELIYHLEALLGLQDIQFFTYMSKINIWNRSPILGVETFSATGRGAGIGVRANYRNLTGSLEYGYPILHPVCGNSVTPQILFSVMGRV